MIHKLRIMTNEVEIMTLIVTQAKRISMRIFARASIFVIFAIETLIERLSSKLHGFHIRYMIYRI